MDSNRFPPWGIVVNLRVVLWQERLLEVSPPFEGGVAGTIDYMIYTKLYTRPGWLIKLILGLIL